METGVSAKVIAALCGLSAFAIAIVAGLAAENPGDVILTRAIIALILSNIVGWFIGAVIERVFADAVNAYRANKPAPTPDRATSPPPQAQSDVLTV